MKVRYINSYQYVLVVSALDSLPLIFVLQNAMGLDDPSLPFDFKFPFENALKSILIKSNLIYEMINQLRQQMKKKKKKKEVKARINLVSGINLKC